jgi:hypothetical protein
MLTDGRFWAGIIVGVVLHVAYQRYRASKSQS